MSRTSTSGWSARAIAASIERSVHDGRLQPAEALPPVRQLARSLGVSPATAAAAYRLLRTRGLTAAEGRRGTRIIPRSHARSGVVSAPLPADIIDLAAGTPDPSLLPPLDVALRGLDLTPQRYDQPPLLPALAQFVRGECAADGIPAGSLTLVGGGLDAIERVLREHLRPGDRVAVEDPCVPAVHDLLVAAGYAPVAVGLDEAGPRPEALAQALRGTCRALIVTTRAQNPTGAAVTSARATDLRAVIRAHPDLLLVETDPCGPIAGAPLETLCDETRHRWVHVRSTSMFLGPDLRMAFIVGDPLTVERVAGRYFLGPRRVSLILQQLVLRLWSDPAAGRQLARASEVYRQRRLAWVEALAARGVSTRSTSGFNTWIPVSQEAQVTRDLADRGWAVAAGEPFRIHEAPGIRVTTAALLPEDAVRLADTLIDVLKPSRHGSA